MDLAGGGVAGGGGAGDAGVVPQLSADAAAFHSYLSRRCRTFVKYSWRGVAGRDLVSGEERIIALSDVIAFHLDSPSLQSLGAPRVGVTGGGAGRYLDSGEEGRIALSAMTSGVVVQTCAAVVGFHSDPSLFNRRLLVSILAFSLLGYLCGVASALLEITPVEMMPNVATVLGWIGVASGSLGFILFTVLCLPAGFGWIAVLPIVFLLVFLITMVIKGRWQPARPVATALQEESRPVATALQE